MKSIKWFRKYGQLGEILDAPKGPNVMQDIYIYNVMVIKLAVCIFCNQYRFFYILYECT